MANQALQACLEAAGNAVDDDAQRDEDAGRLDADASQRGDDRPGAHNERGCDEQIVEQEQVQEHLAAHQRDELLTMSCIIRKLMKQI